MTYLWQGLYARPRMSEILVFWTFVREIVFSVRDLCFPVRDLANCLSAIWPISCPRNGKFYCLRFGKFERDVCGCVVCRQKGHNEQPSVPCLSVFHPRPRVGCLASSHFNSRGEGVPLLSFYRSPKIECRHPCDRMASALQWTLQNK